MELYLQFAYGNAFVGSARTIRYISLCIRRKMYIYAANLSTLTICFSVNVYVWTNKVSY